MSSASSFWALAWNRTAICDYKTTKRNRYKEIFQNVRNPEGLNSLRRERLVASVSNALIVVSVIVLAILPDLFFGVPSTKTPLKLMQDAPNCLDGWA